MKADQAVFRPASRFLLIPAAVLLIIPLIPFTVVSALLSGTALVLALREIPGRWRIFSLLASALLLAVAVLLTVAAIPVGTQPVHEQ